jgi:hypothetical protein
MICCAPLKREVEWWVILMLFNAANICINKVCAAHNANDTIGRWNYRSPFTKNFPQLLFSGVHLCFKWNVLKSDIV